MVAEIQNLPEELPPPVIPAPPAPMDVAAAAATAAAVAAASDSTPGSPSGNNGMAGGLNGIAGMQVGDLNAQLAVAQQTAAAVAAVAASRPGGVINIGGGGGTGGLSVSWRLGEKPRTPLKGRAYLRLGLWQWSMNDVSFWFTFLTFLVIEYMGARLKLEEIRHKGWAEAGLYFLAASMLQGSPQARIVLYS